MTLFAHCPECHTLWLNVSGETLVHSCPAHAARFDTLAELFDSSEKARAERLRRIEASMVSVPVLWAERVERLP